jgi:predicted HAD superfamily Cof-like phosphohydrolase
MTNLYRDVGDFHRKFGLDAYPSSRPRLLPTDEQLFRLAFMYEELAEFQRAWAQGDLVGAVDGLVDLGVVTLGTAHLMRLPFNAHWNEVHRANMQKERADGASDPRSHRQHSLDIVKPRGWVAPDHRPILISAGADLLEK